MQQLLPISFIWALNPCPCRQPLIANHPPVPTGRVLSTDASHPPDLFHFRIWASKMIGSLGSNTKLNQSFLGDYSDSYTVLEGGDTAMVFSFPSKPPPADQTLQSSPFPNRNCCRWSVEQSSFNKKIWTNSHPLTWTHANATPQSHQAFFILMCLDSQ